MKVTIKSYSELKQLVLSKSNSSKLSEDNEKLFQYIGGKTLSPDDFDVFFINNRNNKKYTFIFNSLAPEKNLYNIRIPDDFVNSFDLENSTDNYFCSICGFIVKPDANYQFEIQKIYDPNEKKYIRPTWSAVISSGEDYRCPVCLTQNSMYPVQ